MRQKHDFENYAVRIPIVWASTLELSLILDKTVGETKWIMGVLKKLGRVESKTHPISNPKSHITLWRRKLCH